MFSAEHLEECIPDFLLILSETVPSTLCDVTLILASMCLILVNGNSMFKALAHEMA